MESNTKDSNNNKEGSDIAKQPHSIRVAHTDLEILRTKLLNEGFSEEELKNGTLIRLAVQHAVLCIEFGEYVKFGELDKEFVSVKEAAKILRCSESCIKNYVKNKTLKGRKIDENKKTSPIYISLKSIKNRLRPIISDIEDTNEFN